MKGTVKKSLIKAIKNFKTSKDPKERSAYMQFIIQCISFDESLSSLLPEDIKITFKEV